MKPLAYGAQASLIGLRLSNLPDITNHRSSKTQIAPTDSVNSVSGKHAAA